MKKITTILVGLALVISVNAQFQNSGGMFLRTGSSFMTAPPVEEELRGPDELWDGHTVIWLEDDTLLTEADGAVSAWTDIVNGYTLLPYASDGSAGTSDNYPSWTEAGGVVFDGTDDVLKYMVSGWTTFGSIYAVVKQVSWTNGGVLFGYGGTGATRVSQSLTAEGGSPNIHLVHSSGRSPAILTLTINSWGLLTAEVNGATSTASLQLGDGTPVTNTTSMSGFKSAGVLLGATHAAPPALQRYGNVAIKAIIYRDQIDDSSTKAAIKAYLTSKYL